MTWPDPARFTAINQALAQALALDGAARAAWVSHWCAQAEPSLVAPFQTLLAAAEQEHRCPHTVLGDALVAAMSISAGTRLGDWRLLRRLGHGGMAEVWLARGEGAHQDQHAAVKRPLLPGTNDVEAPLRFRAERRRLAALDDARIARLIDSGVDAQGQPWFAMEYIDGQRIDHYCDAQLLPVRARVRWVREVALAVHSAHQALVVHRDLKPANVLITYSNPQVKLLDFGIAKDLCADEAPTLNPALTPHYASPEQLSGGSITIASDVYQLGLLLYELLCGCRAFAASAARGTPSVAAPAMSEALSTAPDAAAIAARRTTTLTALLSLLRGDLAAIVACATATEPTRRYASAAALAEDLAAWAAGLPVRARLPSSAYRLRRFFARHALASCLIALLLAVAAGALLRSVQQAHQLAHEARAAMQVQAYLINLLRQADPLFSGRPELAPGPLLDASLILARRELREQPALLSDVLQVGADAYIRRADYPTGTALLSEAVALPLARADPRRLQLLARLGQGLHYQSRYAEAERQLREALPLWRDAGIAGNLAVPAALVDVLHSRGDYNAALAVLSEFAPAPEGTFAHFVWQRDLGTVLRDAGQLEQSLPHLQAALCASAGFAGDQGSRGTALLALARWHALVGAVDDTRATAQEGLAIAQRIYGEHAAVPGMFRHSLALAAEHAGDHEEAAALLTRVLAEDYAKVVPGNVLMAYARLDRAWNPTRSPEEVAADLAAAAATLAAVQPAGHPRLSEVYLLRAARAGSRHLAEASLTQAVAVRTAGLGPDHVLTREAAAWREQLFAVAPVSGNTLMARRIARLAAIASRLD